MKKYSVIITLESEPKENMLFLASVIPPTFRQVFPGFIMVLTADNETEVRAQVEQEVRGPFKVEIVQIKEIVDVVTKFKVGDRVTPIRKDANSGECLEVIAISDGPGTLRLDLGPIIHVEPIDGGFVVEYLEEELKQVIKEK